MNEENFLVQFIPSKHCFLQFSNKWFQKINNSKCSCVRLAHPVTKKDLYFTWAPQPSYGLNDCSIGINATFAQGLGLHENELVVVSTEEKMILLQQVFLSPLSSDDYEILETSRDNVEVSLLNQIRIVYIGEVISVWVSKTMHLKLIVDRLEPESYFGKLEQLTELFIENVTKASNLSRIKTQTTNTSNISNSVSSKNSDQIRREPTLWTLLSDCLPKRILDFVKPSDNDVLSQSEMLHQQSERSQLVCRVHPFPTVNDGQDCCAIPHDELLHPFNVYVPTRTLLRDFCSKNTFVQTLLEEQESVVCRFEALPQKKPKPIVSKTTNNDKTKDSPSDSQLTDIVCVRLCRSKDSCNFFVVQTNVGCVYVSQFLRQLLNLAVGSKVRLTPYNPPVTKMPTEIRLVPSRKMNDSEAESLYKQFVERLSPREGILINNCFPLPVPLADGSVSPVLVLFSPEDLECWPLTYPHLQVCPVHVTTMEDKSLESLKGFNKIKETNCNNSSVFRQLIEEGVATLEFELQLSENKNQTAVLNNILITGKQGTGKSRLAEAIYTRISLPPHHVHVNVLDCKPLKGKKPETVRKIVLEHLEECVYFQPAVLVLEDFPCIAGTPINDLESSQETLYYLRLAMMLKEILWRVQEFHRVCVVATAQSRAQVHPQLLSARGRHAFTTFLQIPALSEVERLEILTELLEAKISSVSITEIERLACKTEGCVAQDLHRLVDRVLFKACQRQTLIQGESVDLQATANDVEAALQGFVPSDLANISLALQSPHKFASIGGLKLAKQVLTEILIWPTKYPDVFSQCPLRLERGVLLYGAPGTGKTLLANALVGESGINFITVKGPELLSKYIGASEEAVRNVFEKAQSAQPCILFFDEFDSLAPRRGHDSTGVTDRVVNQLLTQMDGVEALVGVWVVAAASRPDLLDPALLRPGRIGTLIHCPLPDQAERLAILQCLSEKLQISSDTDLAVVAAQTAGYTGADLQAVLFTAQMAAYDALHKDADNDLEVAVAPVGDVVVSQADLLAAVRDTTPSLKPEDRLRFDQIYDRFEQSRGRGASQATKNLRVTLA